MKTYFICPSDYRHPLRPTLTRAEIVTLYNLVLTEFTTHKDHILEYEELMIKLGGIIKASRPKATPAATPETTLTTLD